MRRALAICLALAACAQVQVTVAFAEGRPTIASAPTVVYGQQEFGNTTNGGHIETTCDGDGPLYYSYWYLPTIVGDIVTIDWEATQPKTHLELYPAGTTDFTFGSGSSGFAEQVPNGNGKAEFKYHASRQGGDVILAFRNCFYEPGPYSFTAYVAHALTLGFPRAATLHRHGTIAVAVHNPEGGPVSDPAVLVVLEVRGRRGWQRVGRASVSNSAAVIHYTIPNELRHQLVAIRAIASGPGFAGATSSSTRSRVLSS